MSAGAFTDVRVVAGWAPTAPLRPGFASALRDFDPDVVHLHGGTIAPRLALRRRCASAPSSRRATALRRSHGRPSSDAIRWANGGAIFRSLAPLPPRRWAGVRAPARCATPRRRGAHTGSALEALFSPFGPVFRAQGADEFRTSRPNGPSAQSYRGPRPGRRAASTISSPRFLRCSSRFPGRRFTSRAAPDSGSAPVGRSPRRDRMGGRALRTDPRSRRDVFPMPARPRFPFRWSTTLTPAPRGGRGDVGRATCRRQCGRLPDALDRTRTQRCAGAAERPACACSRSRHGCAAPKCGSRSRKVPARQSKSAGRGPARPV